MLNRRIGILFIVAAILMAMFALSKGALYYCIMWPSLSFGIVGIGYFGSGIRIFSKRQNGSLPPLNIVVLLPYLAYSWGVWHLLRLCLRENAYDELLPNILIGRRLLPSEFPADADRILDLTCEFSEPFAIRSRDGYVCFAILDASGCEIDELLALMLTIENYSGRLYIHCAQGHGRTGLLAAAILLHRRIVNTTDEAIATAKSVRPGINLNRVQLECLSAFAARLEEDSQDSAISEIPDSHI